jgi:hypothetical protein
LDQHGRGGNRSLMSALGYKRAFLGGYAMSAISPKADIG